MKLISVQTRSANNISGIQRYYPSVKVCSGFVSFETSFYPQFCICSLRSSQRFLWEYPKIHFKLADPAIFLSSTSIFLLGRNSLYGKTKSSFLIFTSGFFNIFSSFIPSLDFHEYFATKIIQIGSTDIKFQQTNERQFIFIYID